MKNFMTRNIAGLMETFAGICFMSMVAFANPAMLPDHPGHPMKDLKSPVTGQSLANDPGRNLWTGEKALKAASKAGNEDLILRSRESLLEKQSKKSDEPRKKN